MQRDVQYTILSVEPDHSRGEPGVTLRVSVVDEASGQEVHNGDVFVPAGGDASAVTAAVGVWMERERGVIAAGLAGIIEGEAAAATVAATLKAVEDERRKGVQRATVDVSTALATREANREGMAAREREKRG